MLSPPRQGGSPWIDKGKALNSKSTPKKKLSSTLFALSVVSAAPSFGAELKDPSKCNSFPDDVANVCKQELMRNGVFEYEKVSDVSDCKLLRDSAAAQRCIATMADGKDYYVTRLSAIKVAAEKEIMASDNPDVRVARATEKMAFYTKVQAITIVTVAVFGAIVTLVALAQ